MMRMCLAVALFIAACASAPATEPDLDVVFESEPKEGALLIGRVAPGVAVAFEGNAVPVAPDGRFVIGFSREHAEASELVVSMGEARRTVALNVGQREYKVQRIDGLPPSKVTPRTPEEIAHIERDREKKRKARATLVSEVGWTGGFEWPVLGRISGVYGSQRILNGEPRRPHFGIDVAAPTGTPVKAAADGVITLAEQDMYFEGGLILINHGHNIETSYLHLSSVDVAVGDSVKKGDLVGKVGSTGRSTGPHLHWGLKWGPRPVDPAFLVPSMEEALAAVEAVGP